MPKEKNYKWKLGAFSVAALAIAVAAMVSIFGAGANADLSFDVDNRFITGEYVALNGQHFNATFGFL